MSTQQFGIAGERDLQHTQDPTHDVQEDVPKKPSLLKKVKAKAKKLKSKIKPSSTETSPTGPGAPRAGDQDDTSSSGDSSDEGAVHDNVPYTPMSNAVQPQRPPGATPAPSSRDNPLENVSSGQTNVRQPSAGHGIDPTTKAPRSFEADPGATDVGAPLHKTSETSAVEEAVPTNYSYYNADPTSARRPPGDEASLRQETVPSTVGGESAGISPFLAESAAPGVGHNVRDDSLTGEDRDAVIPRGILTPGAIGHGMHARSSEADRRREPSRGEDKAAENRDALIPQGILTPGSIEQDKGVGFPSGEKVTDRVTGTKEPESDSVYDSEPKSADYGRPATESAQTKPIHHRAYEGLAAAAAGVGGAAAGIGQRFGIYNIPDYDNSNVSGSQDGQPWSQKAYDTAVSTKDAAAEKLSSVTATASDTAPTPSEGKPLTQKAYETVVGSKDAISEKLSSGSADTGKSYTPAQDQTWTGKAYDTVAGTKDALANKLGTGDTGRSPTQSSEEQTWPQKAYGVLAGTKDAAADKIGTAAASSTGKSYTPPQEQTWTQKAYDTAAGTKNAVAEKLGVTGARSPASHVSSEDRNLTQSEGQNLTQKGYDAVVRTKDVVAEKLGATGATSQSTPQGQTWTEKGYNAGTAGTAGAGSNASLEAKTLTQKAYDTVLGAKDAAANQLRATGGLTTTPSESTPERLYESGTGEESHTGGTAWNLTSAPTPSRGEESKPITEKLTETAQGLKETVAGKLGTPGQSLSSDSTPVSQKVTDSAYQAKDSAASAPSDQKPVTEKLTETAYGLKDIVADKLGYADQASTKSAPSPNGGQQKPITEKLTETGYGLKDTIAGKLGYGNQVQSSDSAPLSSKTTEVKDNVASTLGSNDGKPLTDKLIESAVGAKDYVASQLSSSDERPVSEKTLDVANQAKNTTLEKVNPDHHHKALADSITESISTLPSMLTSKLGLSGSAPSSPSSTGVGSPPESGTRNVAGNLMPTASSPPADTSSTTTGTAESPLLDSSAPPASPGVLNRVTEFASSLFGGASKPPTDQHTTGTPHMDRSAATPLGAEAESSPRSSPAA